jgi:hypothetical protein
VTPTVDKDGKKDDDPRGDILVKTDKPLDAALRFLKPLQELSPTILETQLLAFDVHFRRGIPVIWLTQGNISRLLQL